MGNKNCLCREPNSPQLLEENEIKLLLESTDMSRQQIEDFHENFLKDCPNGVITKKQFVKMFKQLHLNEAKKQKADKFVEYVFNAFDHDSNGILEFTDFVVCFSITSFGNLKEKITLAFHIYDLNKNNVIEMKEMLKVVTVLFDLTGKNLYESDESLNKTAKIVVDQMMKKLDKNGDNVLQIDEFVNGCLEDETVRQILIDPMFNC